MNKIKKKIKMEIRKFNQPQKEKIYLKNIIDPRYPNIYDIDGFKGIEMKQSGYDVEKGFCDWDCVIQRISDGKYFKFTFTEFGHNGNSMAEEIAVEVNKKTKTIYFYE
jgi:hypothetical protein